MIFDIMADKEMTSNIFSPFLAVFCNDAKPDKPLAAVVGKLPGGKENQLFWPAHT